MAVREDGEKSNKKGGVANDTIFRKSIHFAEDYENKREN